MKIKHFNQIGFTIIEILIAMSAISVSSVGLLWSINATRENNVRTDLVMSVTDLESAVANALMDENNFPPATKQRLSSGQIPEMSFPLVPTGFTGRPTLRLGRALSLNRNLEPCQSFGTGDCVLQIEAEMRRIVEGARSRFAFAYRITTRDPSVSFRYSGAGANASAQGGFTDDEFKLTVPYDFYLPDLQLACQGSDNIALTGIDVSTGAATCIKQPLAKDACPNGTLPKRLQYINDQDGRRVAFECGAPLQSATCPTNYYLQSIDTTSLDGANQKSGQCVYAGAHTFTATIPQGATNATRIRGQVCPPGYRSVSRCYIDPATVVSTPGTCSWCYGAALNCATSTVAEVPVGSGNYRRTTNFFCSDTTGNVQGPNAGRVEFDENQTAPGYIDCRLQRAQLDCGATWTGALRVDVTCEMYAGGNPAEVINVQ